MIRILLAALFFVSAHAFAVDPIPSTILNGLKGGGVNLVFEWYDVDNYNPTGMDAELPLIKAAGGEHVRLAISMDVMENGTTGQPRADRWQHLKNFVNLAKSHGLVTIIDMHNTGQKNPDGTWTIDYMGGLRNAGVRARHLSLLTTMAQKIYAEMDRNWVVLQPANEPIFTGGASGEPSIWYNHQDALIPALRNACPDCVIFAMANVWQGIGASIWTFQPQNKSWLDARIVIDMHHYQPQALTHCSFPGSANNCPGKTWPGTYSDWLPTQGVWYSGVWNKSVLENDLQSLWSWRDTHGLTLHFSEIGTAGDLADGPRGAYLNDLTSIFMANGAGWSCYEWNKNFGIKNAPLTKAACLRGSGAALTINYSTTNLNASVVKAGDTLAASTSLTANQNVSGLTLRYRIKNGAGTTVHEIAQTAVNLNAGVPYNFSGSYAIPSSMADGSYSIELGIWNSSSVNLVTVSNAASFTKTTESSPLVVSYGATTVNPATVSAGTNLTLATTLTANQNVSGLVFKYIIKNSAGVSVHEITQVNSSLSAYVPAVFTGSYVIPSSMADGTYNLSLEVRASNGNLLASNVSAGSFQKTSSSGPATISYGATNASPSSVQANTTLTLSTPLTASQSLSGLHLGYKIKNSSGTVLQELWLHDVSMTGGTPYSFVQTHVIPSSFADGTYTIEMGGYNSNWSHTYFWNPNVATFTKTSGGGGGGGGNGTITYGSTTASPSTVYVGSTLSLTTSLTANQNLSGLHLGYKIKNSAGTVLQELWLHEVSMTGGSPYSFVRTYVIPSSFANGVYTIEMGGYNSNWSHTYFWSPNVTTFTKN